MKKIILPILFACCATLNAQDCARNSDACSAGAKTAVSPFLAASAQPQKTAPVQSTAAKKTAAVQPAPLAVPATVQLPVTVPVELPAETGGVSSPLWLLLVGGGLAALYFYLGGKNKKGKRK